MGCCGDKEDDDDDDGAIHPLLTSSPHDLFVPAASSNPPSSCDDPSSSTISPMNSNFSALFTRDLLRFIFELLPTADLARAACVCRFWSAVASERDVQERVFTAPWKVRRVLGEPSSPAFWRHAGLGRFAISHRLGRGDTVASLALKYSVQVMDIKRLNNMISDHGIYSRDRLLIPIGNPNLLIDQTCYIEMDIHARREVAVLYLEGGPKGHTSCVETHILSEMGRKKILRSVKRSMGVDDGTAEYYLSISNDDPRMALMEFSQDLQWEHQRRLN